VCLGGCALVLIGLAAHLAQLSHDRTRLGEKRSMQERLDSAYINNRVSVAIARKKESNKKKRKAKKAAKYANAAT